jgi:hypothetical protein
MQLCKVVFLLFLTVYIKLCNMRGRIRIRTRVTISSVLRLKYANCKVGKFLQKFLVKSLKF